MKSIPQINLEDFNYCLPDELIAQFPLEIRSNSKLLIYEGGKIIEDKFRNIASHINEKSFIILNDTKVINARILFNKQTGAKIEIFCLEPAYGIPIEKSFSEKNEVTWKCMVGNASKWHNEILTKKIDIGSLSLLLHAQKIEEAEGEFIIRFFWDEKISFSEILFTAGNIPLPPYIKRIADEKDKMRYQTVYAKNEGSVAAPTAGLHFDEKLIGELKEKNSKIDFITLNVGAGTFKPVKNKNIAQHKMHEESFIIRKDFLKNLYSNFDYYKIAVGTTSIRTLESLYWLGVNKIKSENENFQISQWEAYQQHCNISGKESLELLIGYLEKNNLDYIYGKTSLMMIPGYKFHFTDALITNFHLPYSTLLMLIAAFVGSEWKEIYNYALKNNFRFLSYGDSSFLKK